MNKNMKKVGIITIISNNLGNRLQNYALQEILSKLGMECSTIPMKSGYGHIPKSKLHIKSFLSFLFIKYNNVTWDKFNQNIIWESKNVNDLSTEEINKFDYFIAGSDQIWNPLFKFNSSREFLVFAKSSQKVAYSASIGLEELPNNVEEKYAKYLHDFKAISVREDAAAQIIQQILGINCPVLIDPTMLINTDKWISISKKPKINIKEKFAVMYVLGIEKEGLKAYITEDSKRRNIKVIDIVEYNMQNNYAIGPSEFIYLISHCDYIYTDSFHGTIFSILFHKDFLVFERPEEKGYGKMSSRIDTLLNKFELNERKLIPAKQLKFIISSIKYSNVDILLEVERKKAINYLQNALK